MNIAPISEPKTMIPAQAATQNTRRDAIVEVVQRVGDPSLADDERDAGDDRDDRQAEREGALVRDRREVDGRGSAAPTSTADRMPPRLSTFSVVSLTWAGHEPDRHDERDGGQRQRDEEDRAPLEALEQETGHERAQRRDRATERRPQRDRPRPAGPGPQRGDEGQRRRVGHAGRDAAEDPGDDQDLDRSGRTRRGGRPGSTAARRGRASACGRSGRPARRATGPRRPGRASSRRRRGRAPSATRRTPRRCRAGRRSRRTGSGWRRPRRGSATRRTRPALSGA